MSRLILLNKPFGMLCQFSGTGPTLAALLQQPGVYPAGRLDWDSEGLLLLTDDGALQAHIASPRFHQAKTYLVQVEGEPSEDALQRLRQGITRKDGPCRPAPVEAVPDGRDRPSG